MSVLISKSLAFKIFMASVFGTILSFVIYNLIAKGSIDLSLRHLVFVGVHALVGVTAVYCFLKWISMFNFLSFILIGWLVVYAVMAVYSFKIGYGSASLIIPLFLSVFSLPGIFVSWLILVGFFD